MRPKLTEEPIDQMAELKGDGLSNKNICRAVGIHEATLYRWLNKSSSKLHRALGESLKKGEGGLQARRSPPFAKRRFARTASGRQRRGCWSASTPTSTRRRRATGASGWSTRYPPPPTTPSKRCATR